MALVSLEEKRERDGRLVQLRHLFWDAHIIVFFGTAAGFKSQNLGSNLGTLTWSTGVLAAKLNVQSLDPLFSAESTADVRESQ